MKEIKLIDSTHNYGVWLENKLQEGFSLEDVLFSLRKMFPNNDNSIRNLISKRNSYISTHISLQKASKIVGQLNACGLVCRISRMSPPQRHDITKQISRKVSTAITSAGLDDSLVKIKRKVPKNIRNIVHQGAINLSPLMDKAFDRGAEAAEILGEKARETAKSYGIIHTGKYKQFSNAYFIKWLAILNAALLVAAYILSLGNVKILLAVFVLSFFFPIISLHISKSLIIKKHGVKIIMHNRYRNNAEKYIYETVLDVSNKIPLPKVPQVGYYASPEINAFACGANKDDCLIAFTVPLLKAMTPEQFKAVVAHEVAHIANADMVGTTMLEGCISSYTKL